MKLFHMTFFGLVAVLLLGGVALSQSGGTPDIPPKPEVTVDFRAGDSTQTAEPGTTGATILAVIPQEKECECGAKFEARLSGTTEWIILALYSPVETGDGFVQSQWVYTGNFFDINKNYEIRVQIFDRGGIASQYGQAEFTMVPYSEAPCSNRLFSNVKRTVSDTPDYKTIIFSWDKVCASSAEANRYKVYKNGQLVGENDVNNFAVTGTPIGATWKVEAFGEEPPNSDPDVIKTCGEVIAKINAKTHGTTYSTQARIASLNECQVVGTWLRAIITWEPYISTGGYNNQELSPPAWMNITLNNPQYFNYPLPRNWNPRPGFPGQVFPDAFDKCGYNNQNTSTGSYTDPWGSPHGPQSWTCNIEYNSSNNATIYRYWINFDLNATGSGEPVWPITTTFSY